MNRARRGLIRVARGEDEAALADTDRGLELARTAKDLQLLGPVLVMRANVLNSVGRREEASALLTEVLRGESLSFVKQGAFADDLIGLAWIARDLGRGDELDAILGSDDESSWRGPTKAVLRGDPAAAADALESLRSDTAAAYTRYRGGLELMAEGRSAEGDELLRKALEFHRKAGATGYVREAEDLLSTVTSHADSRRTTPS